MRHFIITLLCTGIVTAAFSQTASTLPSAEAQIKAAVLAAPADKRAGATVYGYTVKGWGLLRKGTNEMICLADDPEQKGLNVVCYHRDLDAFMERGRQLKKQGKNQQDIFDTREKEVKEGKLAMPKQPSTLFAYTASEENFTPATGEAKEGYLRYVIYIPFATAESTGLPLRPESPGMPWIMHAGTHGAHIMINPPKN